MESHIHELKNYYFMNSLNIIHGMVKETINTGNEDQEMIKSLEECIDYLQNVVNNII